MNTTSRKVYSVVVRSEPFHRRSVVECCKDILFIDAHSGLKPCPDDLIPEDLRLNAVAQARQINAALAERLTELRNRQTGS
jgi:hypothetical protein